MKTRIKQIIQVILVGVFSLTAVNLNAMGEKTPDWLLIGIDNNIPIYFSDEEGNKLSEEFLPIELDTKIEELSQKIKPYWSATASETTQYLTSGGYSIIVPIIRRSDTNEVVACMQSGANYPNATEYQGLGDPYHDENILGIMYYGNPNNGISELAQQYGLDWYKAHNGWQTALWRVLKSKGYPTNDYDYIHLDGDQNLINYINDLASRTYSNVVKDFNINFDGIVHQADPQKTNPMGITEYLPFSTNVSSPAYTTDLNGNPKSSFGAGEQFIVVAPAIFIGKLDVTVTTEQITFATIIYRAKFEDKQDLGFLDMSDPAILQKTVNLDFKGALGEYSFQKLTNQNAVVDVDHNITSVVFKVTREDTNYSAEHTVKMDGSTDRAEVLLGIYDYEEIHWSDTMQPTVKKKGKFEVKPSEHYIIQVDNDTAKGKLPIEKEVINPTSDTGNKDYKPTDNLDKIQVNVVDKEQHFNYNKNNFLEKQGKLTLSNMPIGAYDIKEISVPKDLHINPTVFSAFVENETTTTTKITHITNIAKKSRIEVGKRDTNTGWVPNVTFDAGSSLMKDSKGIPLVYTLDENGKDVLAPNQKVTPDGKYYNLIDPTTKIDTVTTGEHGKVFTKWFLYGYEEVYIQEVAVPNTGHLMINKIPKLITLKEEETVFTEFTNVLDELGVIQIPKTNEDKETVEWFFPIYRIEQNGTRTYMETIVTSKLNGIGNSTPLQLVRADNTNIDYEICEKQHPLYKNQNCKIIKRADFNKSTNIAVVPFVNYWKEVKFVLPKVAESNVYDIKADGTEFKIWDKVTKEILAIGVVKNNLAEFSTIKVPKVLDNKNLEYYETKTVNGLILDTKKYPIETITEQFLTLYTSGTPIYLKEKSDPLVNKLPTPTLKTTATVDEVKTIKPNQEKVWLIDKVEYTNLIVGKEYTLKGLLMDKKTGKPLLINGKEVRAEHKFKPTEKDGFVNIVFEFDTRGIDEETDIVVFEYLEYNKKPVIDHTDITDVGQTVTVTKPILNTTAINQDGGKTVPVDSIVTITDVVEYYGLTVGEEYELRATLMDKTTEKPVVNGEQEITNIIKFIPTQSCGTIEITLTFDTTGLSGRELVVFEEATREEKPITEHKDITDIGQTIKVEMPQLPVTGQNKEISLAISSLLLVAGICMLFFKRLNKKIKK